MIQLKKIFIMKNRSRIYRNETEITQLISVKDENDN